jgi:hypothetical protein
MREDRDDGPGDFKDAPGSTESDGDAAGVPLVLPAADRRIAGLAKARKRLSEKRKKASRQRAKRAKNPKPRGITKDGFKKALVKGGASDKFSGAPMVVMRWAPLSPRARLLYHELFSFFWNATSSHLASRSAWPTLATLAANTGMSAGTVRRALRSLILHGLIERELGERRGRPWERYIYRLLPPPETLLAAVAAKNGRKKKRGAK